MSASWTPGSSHNSQKVIAIQFLLCKLMCAVRMVFKSTICTAAQTCGAPTCSRLLRQGQPLFGLPPLQRSLLLCTLALRGLGLGPAVMQGSGCRLQ